MPKKWILKEVPPRDEAFERSAGVSEVLSCLLRQRGLSDPARAGRFLKPSRDAFFDPVRYTDMSKAVGRIRLALEKKQKVLVYGDYDVDGLTAAAIVAETLQRLGADVRTVIPDRLREGYGLHLGRLKSEIRGVGLVITVDNGITNAGEIAYLASKKIDTIVVDHHQVDEIVFGDRVADDRAVFDEYIAAREATRD